MTAPWLDDGDVQLYHGDVIQTLQSLPAGIVQTVVTSPPYWGLRDYGTGAWDGGDADCDHVRADRPTRIIDRDTAGRSRRLVRDRTPASGTRMPVAVWCSSCRPANSASKPPPTPTSSGWSPCSARCGASSATTAPSGSTSATATPHGMSRTAGMTRPQHGRRGEHERQRATRAQGYRRVCRRHGLKPKDLVGIPWRVAFALQADGWYLRSDIIWTKPNPMPESVVDRPTKAHEYLFLLTKRPRYYWDADAIREDYLMSSRSAKHDVRGSTSRSETGIRSGAKGSARANGAADGQRHGATSLLR